MSRLTRAAAVLLAGMTVPIGAAQAEDRTLDEIARYREMLAEDNPADLFELRGAALWKERRGPKAASLELCDLGLGPGVVDGAYARLPRYFSDTGRVMDAESRVVHCMVTLQGLAPAEATRNWYAKGAIQSDMEAIVTYLGARSNGRPIEVPARHPKEQEMLKIGEYIFYRRAGPQDFGCAICHGKDGVRIRLQELDNLASPKGAGKAMSTWPSYRVSQGTVWTMQRRLIDCMRQARWPENIYPSDAVIALETFLQNKASGTILRSPGIKR